MTNSLPPTFVVYAFSNLLSAFCFVALALVVFLYHREFPRNQLFALWCISVSVWAFGIYEHTLAISAQSAMFWGRVLNASAALIPVFFLDFILRFLDSPKRYWLQAAYLVGVAIAVLALYPTDLLIREVSPVGEFRFYPKAGVAYPIYALFFVLCAGYGFYKLWAASRVAIGLRRNQVRYLLVAAAIGFSGGCTTFLPVFDVPVFPYGNYGLVLLGGAIIAYAIVRHRLMDISVVVNKGLAYAILLGTIVVATSIGAVLSNRATAHSVPPLLAGTLFLICGLWVLFNNARAVTNVTFALLCGAACVWLFGFFMVYSAAKRIDALLWEKIVYVGVVYIPAFSYHFCRSLLGQGTKDRWIGRNYLVSTAFLLMVPTSLIVDGQYSHYWGNYPKAGVLHPLFLLYFLAVSCAALYALFKGYQVTSRLASAHASQLKYTFGALFIGFASSADFLQSYGFGFYPLGYLFAGLSVTVVGYTIVKYRLMEVTLVPTGPNAVLSIKLLSLIPAYLVILLIIVLFTGTTNYLLAGVLFATFVGVAGVLNNLQQAVERAVGQTLFRDRYDAYDTLVQFSKSLVTILELRALTKEIVLTLARVMNIRTASLYVLDKEKGVYTRAAFQGLGPQQPESPLVVTPDNHLIHELVHGGAILVREELEYHRKDEASAQVLETLKQLDAEVCMPLLNKERLVGFCNLGHRTTRAMYSSEELSLLTTLAQHAAIAIDNALLYEDLRRSQLVMRRTDRLRSLETMAGGFAHEIRNPLTSIKTFIQLAPDRRDDAEFMEQFSQVVSEDVERIERLIQEILDYARYMTPKLTQEHLNDIVASCLYFVEVKASSKSIVIQKHLASDIPPVKLDRQQIKQVLLNLFINAMEAMGDRGGILTARTHLLARESGDPWVQIEITDSGPGIAPADLEHIFDPFYTTKHESGEREGTGLGLTIAHQIIQEHGGYIEVSSQVGQGTTFFVNLPANPPLAEWHGEGEEGSQAVRQVVPNPYLLPIAGSGRETLERAASEADDEETDFRRRKAS